MKTDVLFCLILVINKMIMRRWVMSVPAVVVVVQCSPGVHVCRVSCSFIALSCCKSNKSVIG